jgi:hypothetical protein
MEIFSHVDQASLVTSHFPDQLQMHLELTSQVFAGCKLTIA